MFKLKDRVKHEGNGRVGTVVALEEDSVVVKWDTAAAVGILSGRSWYELDGREDKADPKPSLVVIEPDGALIVVEKEYISAYILDGTCIDQTEFFESKEALHSCYDADTIIDYKTRTFYIKE